MRPTQRVPSTTRCASFRPPSPTPGDPVQPFLLARVRSCIDKAGDRIKADLYSRLWGTRPLWSARGSPGMELRLGRRRVHREVSLRASRLLHAHQAFAAELTKVV